MSQFKKNGTMELETSIGYSFSLIKTEYKQNKIYQNKKKTKRTVNLSFQSALCQQSETFVPTIAQTFFYGSMFTFSSPRQKVSNNK